MISKLQVFLRQLQHMSFKRWFMHIYRVHRYTGISKAQIMLDMIWCELRYGIGYLDYNVYGFANRRGPVRKTYMTANDNIQLTRSLNKPEYTNIVNDKLNFYSIFKDYIQRDFIDLRQTDPDGLKSFCRDKKAVFSKPLDNCGGVGIRKIFLAENTDYHKLYKNLMKTQNYDVEDALIQHPEMDQLCPDCINTLRVVTLSTPTGILVLYVLLRIGLGGKPIDNISGGGMYTRLYSQKITRPAFSDKTARQYTIHPMTGTKLIGFTIPYYAEALDLAIMAAERIKDKLGYIGWDIAITVDGPAIVEGNDLPGYDMCQNHIHAEHGILPRVEELTGLKIK